MKYLVSVLILTLIGTGIFAQDVYVSSGHTGYHKKHKKKGYDPDKLILGGGINAAFSGGDVDFGISPVVGYRFKENFSAGVGLGYQFYKSYYYSDNNNDYYIYENIIYPSVWCRYFFYKNVYLTGVVEYDFISLRTPEPNYITNGTDYTTQNVNVTCLLGGMGFKQPLGGRLCGTFEILYDFLAEKYSPYYQQPVMRLGFLVGL